MHSGGWLYHIGKYMVMLKDLFVNPERVNMYWKETLRQMQQIGVGSLIIIIIISVFIGAVTSWQLSYNLRDSFVPLVYVGYIVKESMIMELAPTISCLLLAGKVGSNISSELGTMRLTEQIDALEIMGVNTTAYLVGPKIIAAMIMIPILVIISATMGIWGGMMSVGLSGLVSYVEFTEGAQTSFVAFNIWLMIIKSITFGFLLTSIACYQGFYAYGGALDIGKASTRAVVISCILILITDFVLAWMLL